MKFLHPELQSSIHVGDDVRSRGERWSVSRVDTGDGCLVISLVGRDAGNHGVERRLITPADRIERIVVRRRLHVVGRERWRRECRALIACDGAPPILRTALTARMQLMPHQLAPVLAVVRGLGSRLLIADAVGLGKTVQAGLIVAELRARHVAARALILTPAGVREQWMAELAERFGLRASLFDAAGVRQRQRRLPVSVSPWATESLVIASTDYVKRPEVRRAVAASRWDIVVVDEAHGAVAPSDRHAAVSLLCRSASYVVLLTATPHSGDERAFDSLCGIGQRDDALLVFRRSRADVGLPQERRIHHLVVRPTDAERRMHAILDAFAQAVARDNGADERVALIVSILRKRAQSSASSLSRSIDRRLRLLPENGAPDLAQLALPFDTDGELNNDDGMPDWRIPVLRNASEERAWLTRLSEAARAASGQESKLRALGRLIARLREPVVVFTEYRDTLTHVRALVAPEAALLHGGLSRDERRRALARFAQGGTLLATDAAGEGLNLHHFSRVVINLELPWNPMRLEQRIGRVDRIGQARRVHAFHLLAGETDELIMRERLAARIATADRAIGAANPLARAPRHGEGSGTSPRHTAVDDDVHAEARRLHTMRQLAAGSPSWPVLDGGPLMTSSRSPVRVRLGDQTLVLFVALATTPTTEPIALHLTAVLWRPRADMRLADLDWLGGQVGDTRLSRWRSETTAAHQAFCDRKLARLTAIAGDYDLGPGPSQSGLFDQRAISARVQQSQGHDRARTSLELAIAATRRHRDVRFTPLTVALVLRP